MFFFRYICNINFSHMFSLLQVLTKMEQDISNHSYTALKKMACLLEVVNYIAFLCEYDLSVPLLFSQLSLKLLAWHLKGGELVSKPPAEYFLRPGFFLPVFEVNIVWHEPDKSPVPTAKGPGSKI